jgi:multiple antibiotic resistance protein
MHFFESFIPLFVTIDPIGLLPVFLSLTASLHGVRRRAVTYEAVFSAVVIAVSFMFLGKLIFHFLGITVADFQIAGGAILLVFAMIDLLIPGKPAVPEESSLGLFPLAMPLIVGPATLTTTLVLANRDGYWLTSASLILNFTLLLFVLLAATKVAKLVGLNALRAFSKVVMVLLAAIAVNLIRTGMLEAWIQMQGRR